jgi:hypothetical protein
MNLQTETIILVEKEAIENFNFPEQEVLNSQEEKAERRFNAEKAMKLGNYFKDKVKIIFEDAEGMKMVETTVWGVTDRKLLLKRGITIPLNRIYEIVI